MKRLFTISALLFFSWANAQSPVLVWAKNMGGMGGNRANGSSVAVDVSGNVYTTGTFGGECDFDPGVGIYNLTAPGDIYHPNDDIFISKLDAFGNFVWAKALGGPQNDHGLSIALDKAGNIYVTGEFRGTADFDPGPGTHSLTSAGDFDVFVCKLNAAGGLVWARQMGGAGSDGAGSVAVDAFGNVYTAGGFDSTGDFDPGPGVHNLTGNGSNVFISKLDASGNFVWAKQLGNHGGDFFGVALKVDRGGNVYTTGTFTSLNDFDPGPATYNLNTYGLWDIFISKLDASGNFVWAKSMGGIYDDVVSAITIDGAGNVFTTGRFGGTGDFDPGPGTYNLTASYQTSDIFVSKLDASGNFVWAKKMGGPRSDLAYSIATDAAGNVYTTGRFSGSADFDPGRGIYELTTAFDLENVFVSKLDSSGNFVFAGNFGGRAGGWATNPSIVLDRTGNMYITGIFFDQVNFSLSPDYDMYLNSGTGSIFVVKIAPPCMTVDTAGNQAAYYTIYYRDADGDGYGNPGDSIRYCTLPPGYVPNNKDCNDNDSTINARITYYRDDDHDGFGDPYHPSSFCSNVAPPGFATNNYDCYDHEGASTPGYVRIRMCHDGWTQCVYAKDTTEKLRLGWTLGLCSLQSCATGETLMCHNGKQECVKTTDVVAKLAESGGKWSLGPYCSGVPISACNEVDTTYYLDLDRDGFGDPNHSITASTCTLPIGYVPNNTDCNDNDNTIHAKVTYYRDDDHDGFGDSYHSISACSNMPPSGYATNNYDCYDHEGASDPGFVRIRMCHDGWTQCVYVKDTTEKLRLGWTMGLCSLQSCAADETLMCHNGKQECVKTTDVAAKLRDAGGKWSLGRYCSGVPISESGSNSVKKTDIARTEKSLPAQYSLSNHPNPFAGTSTIKYELPFDSKVSIKVYDLAGRAVATLVDAYKKAGTYTVNFNARNISSGSLFYKIIARSKEGQFERTNQMIKIK